MVEATKLPVKNDTNSPQSVERGWLPFESLRREIDRLFDDFHPFDWRLPTGRTRPALEPVARGSEWPMAPAVDWVEREGEYEITAELPGIDEDKVDIRLANRILTIRGEKSEEKEEKQTDYYLSERRFGSFQRSFRLPDGVDLDGIEANFSKGVLTVRLPKTADAKKAEKKISVKAA
ncbi:Hsp20/alpha crystallin family protein [Nitratireductor mangrovi]|uniref:Hsp20/alpha crystallin family protein n=1 Tax=Nitratireductor mangrovi TaxID=2599600 RepID=A0A5B8L0E2_9HYPH|nr:Hsp20/alpha crystallin family protein [Nitratireductor mangrovi]QDZ01356.1 Hsp20/alpha crystallin family protein [Nitratireductor mangrovi]